MTKQELLKIIEDLPDDFPFDELAVAFERIIPEILEKHKIEEGLKASAEGLTISHGEVKQRMTRLTSN